MLGNQHIKHTCRLCGKLFNCSGFPKRVRMDCLCNRIYYCEEHR